MAIQVKYNKLLLILQHLVKKQDVIFEMHSFNILDLIFEYYYFVCIKMSSIQF